LGMAMLCLGLATGFFRSLALAGVKVARPLRLRRLFANITWVNSRLVLFTLLTLGFPLSIVLRLTSSGWQVGNRLGTFVALGSAAVAAVAAVGLWQGASTNRLRAVAVTGALTLMLLSGVVLGWGPNPIPFHYKVGADAMSVEPLGINAAEWTREWLGAGNRFATDRINMVLLATYGRQIPVTSLQDHVDISYVIFARNFAPDQLEVVREGMVDYLMVDLRLTTALPGMGAYFEGGEDAEIHSRPPDTAALLKYDAISKVSRPFDNGVAVVYDVRSLYAQR
jgi:hypothetical protein